MKSFAQALDLKDDPAVISAYREWHTKVYPEVLASLRRIGIRRMKIFLLGTRLFMYYEAPDDFVPSRDYQNYARDPRCAAWDTFMRTFQQKVPCADPVDWWADMDLVFDLETA